MPALFTKPQSPLFPMQDFTHSVTAATLSVLNGGFQPLQCGLFQLLCPLLSKTGRRHAQALEIQLPGQLVPKSGITAGDEDLFLSEVLHSLSLLIPSAKEVKPQEGSQVEPHG